MADRKEQERNPKSDYAGGYGGGRNRAEETPDHSFGERGFGEGAGTGGREPADDRETKELPEGVKDVGEGDPGWDERYVRENADKYGQAGGQPTKQRGPAQSTGGHPEDHEPVGDASDLSPRGGVGIRETEKRPGTPDDK